MTKNIHFLVLTIIVLTATSEAFAQKFGVKAGLNLSNNTINRDRHSYTEDGYSSWDAKTKRGFHIGATAEFPFNDKFSLETGLLCSTKGYRGIGTSSSDIGKSNNGLITNLVYLDIPLTGKATFSIGSTKVYGLFGSYLGMGLAGKRKIESSWNNARIYKLESDIKFSFGESNAEFRRLDFGLTAGTGVEIKSFQIGVAYQLGLVNVLPAMTKPQEMSNRVFSVSVGYILSKK